MRKRGREREGKKERVGGEGREKEREGGRETDVKFCLLMQLWSCSQMTG